MIKMESAISEDITTDTGIASGVSRSIPILLGYIPVGIAFGLLAMDAGIPPLLVVLMSTLVLGAASQIIAIQLITLGADLWVIVVTTFVVNLRHMLMASYLAPHLNGWGRRSIALFSFGLTDEAFALHATRLREGKLPKTEAITINVMALVSWIVGTVLGVLVGPLVVDNLGLSLEYALPAMFIALVVLLANSLRLMTAAIVAGCVSVTISLVGGSQWSALLATLIAATLASVTQRWNIKR